MDAEETQTAPSPRDRAVSLYGQRALPYLPEQLITLIEHLVEDAALGLILIDASPLAQIERRYGTRAFRNTLDGLAQRVRNRLEKEIGDGFEMTSGTLDEDQILFFVHRPRSDREFYAHRLPQLAEELREYVAICLKRVAYPYLTRGTELPVASGMALQRTFQRPETQIRYLVEQTLANARFQLERVNRDRGDELKRIIIEENLTTLFEPIVLLADNRTIGYEALTRGPVGSGLESPDRLFTVADLFGLEYELDSLCRRLALQNAVGIAPGQRLFLNILPTSIHDPSFSETRVREALERAGLSPQSLVLEISEREAIDNFPIFREAIDHFSNLGFGIALDDVGAGYSSLASALELSPNFLKMDMSLVRGVNENAHKQELLRGLKSLAERMGAHVIAEGIETEAELRTVRSLGVHLGQGYLFGRARPMKTD